MRLQLFNILLVSFVFLSNALAQETLPEEGRIVPLESKNVFEGSTFSVGSFLDAPLYRSADYFKQSGYGFSLSFDQHIRSFWSGGMQFRWSEWERHTWDEVKVNDSNENGLKYDEIPSGSKSLKLQPQKVFPVSIFTKVEAAPQLTFLSDESLVKRIRPFLNLGLGYFQFTSSRTIPVSRVKSERAEVALNWGAGIRFGITENIGLRFAVERWRGVKTFDYNGLTYQCELVLGDVLNR